MFRQFLAALALSVVLAANPAFAQYQGVIAPDRSFGSGGFAALPVVSPATPGSVPLGFVRMPSSGGYLYFSVQQVGANLRVIASRYTDAGAINTGWGSGGNLVYAVPVPDGVGGGAPLEDIQARVVVGLEGSPAAEIVYLVGRFSGNLTVARFAADGTFLSFASDPLPIGFAFGPGSISAVAAGGNLFGGNTGLLVAVQGRSSEINRTALIQIQGGSIFETFGIRLNRPDLRINQIVLQADGKADLVGTQGAKATYLRYDARSNVLLNEQFFDLPCASSATLASVADGIVRGGALVNDVLISGRSQCGSGQQSSVVRIASVETLPTVAWSIGTGTDLGGCTALLDPCLASFVTLSGVVPGRAYAVTPGAYLAQVDVTGSGRLLGRDALMGEAGGSALVIVPSNKFGASHAHPSIAGIGYSVTPGGAVFGFGRVVLDRLFAGEFDQ